MNYIGLHNRLLLTLDILLSPGVTIDLLGKPLCDIENKRLQRVLTRAQNFNLNPTHVPGVTNQIADCLSRLCGGDIKDRTQSR